MTEVVPPEPLERSPTGIPGLDSVLGGGVFAGGLYLVLGEPGTGKTVLGNQMCFHHVQTAGGPAPRALYVTLMAESHGRMLSHLASLAFFTPSVVGRDLIYVGGYRTLEEKGLEGLLDLVRVTVRDLRASLVVIDGLVSAEALATSRMAFKRFIHQLSVFAQTGRCTTWLLTSQEDTGPEPEHTMVDGIFEVTRRQVGVRAVREIVVQKLRGTRFLEGRHALDIGSIGITVYPRTEARMAAFVLPAPEATTLERLGVVALDRMLGGGVLTGSSTMVLGGAGTGKTSLALHFTAAAGEAGQPAVFVGFYESPPRLLGKARQLGLALDRDVEAGRLRLIWRLPVEAQLDALADEILSAVSQHAARRLVLDGLGGFAQAAVYPERLMPFVTGLVSALRAHNITTVFTLELPTLFGSAVEVPLPGVSALVENIVLLRTVEEHRRLRRLISILKVRDRDYDATTREFTISARGLTVKGVAARRP